MSAGPWIIVLERGAGDAVYKADTPGDPGRTYSLEAAQPYASRRGASQGLSSARRYRPFADAEVMTLEQARSERAWRRERERWQCECQDLIDMLRRMLHLWETGGRPTQGEADAMQAASDRLRGKP